MRNRDGQVITGWVVHLETAENPDPRVEIEPLYTTPQPDRTAELEAETTKLKLGLLTSYGEAEELSGKVAELMAALKMAFWAVVAERGSTQVTGVRKSVRSTRAMLNALGARLDEPLPPLTSSGIGDAVMPSIERETCR